MKLESDPNRVKRLAEEREDENWRFRTFLKGIDLEIQELDAIVHRHYEDVARQIDCCACGNCCREVTPIFSDTDVLRLATGLGMSTGEFVERFLIKDEDSDMILRDSPCPFYAGSLCTVYDHRPDDCRSFPHLNKDEFVVRLIQVVQSYSVCPVVFNLFEGLQDELWNAKDDVWGPNGDWDDFV